MSEQQEMERIRREVENGTASADVKFLLETIVDIGIENSMRQMALRGALQMMWDTACKSRSSTPSKAAFLRANKVLHDD